MSDPLLKPVFPAGSGLRGTIRVKDEGVTVGEYISTLDFVGESVEAVQTSLGTITITIASPLAHTLNPDGTEAVPTPQSVFDNDGGFVFA